MNWNFHFDSLFIVNSGKFDYLEAYFDPFLQIQNIFYNI